MSEYLGDLVMLLTLVGREVEISFEGRLVGTEGSRWIIGGLTVEVPEGVWEGDVPQSGELLQVEAQVRGGKIIVERIRKRRTNTLRKPAQRARFPIPRLRRRAKGKKDDRLPPQRSSRHWRERRPRHLAQGRRNPPRLLQ